MYVCVSCMMRRPYICKHKMCVYVSCMRPYKGRFVTRDGSITHTAFAQQIVDELLDEILDLTGRY